MTPSWSWKLKGSRCQSDSLGTTVMLQVEFANVCEYFLFWHNPWATWSLPLQLELTLESSSWPRCHNLNLNSGCYGHPPQASSSTSRLNLTWEHSPSPSQSQPFNSGDPHLPSCLTWGSLLSRHVHSALTLWIFACIHSAMTWFTCQAIITFILAASSITSTSWPHESLLSYTLNSPV